MLKIVIIKKLQWIFILFTHIVSLKSMFDTSLKMVHFNGTPFQGYDYLWTAIQLQLQSAVQWGWFPQRVSVVREADDSSLCEFYLEFAKSTRLVT